MMITTGTLAKIAGRAENANMTSTVEGLKKAGLDLGLDRPHRLAMYLAQTAHESMGWHYDREIWGPTAAQERYDTRTDLGNTPQVDGDGYMFRGRTPFMLTGGANYGYFTDWARSIDRNAPDFTAYPDEVNTDPWEGLVGIWFWQRNSLNRYADAGDFSEVTKRVNGGYNGYTDRKRYYGRVAMVLMGRSPTSLREWQRENDLVADGIVGPNTIAALHRALSSMDPVQLKKPTGQIVLGTDWLSRLLARIFGAFK